MRIGSWILGLSSLLPAQERTAIVELNLFSGRMPPKAIVSDSASVDSLATEFSKAILNPVARTEVPPMPSTPAYTGVRLGFSPLSPPSGGLPEYMIRAGYLCEIKDDYSCWADSGQMLERLALRIAFRGDDLNHPGGALPMGYLACMIPDSLRPAAAICSTSALVRRNRSSVFAVPVGPQVDAAGRTLETTGSGRSDRTARRFPLFACPPSR